MALTEDQNEAFTGVLYVWFQTKNPEELMTILEDHLSEDEREALYNAAKADMINSETGIYPASVILALGELP